MIYWQLNFFNCFCLKKWGLFTHSSWHSIIYIYMFATYPYLMDMLQLITLLINSFLFVAPQKHIYIYVGTYKWNLKKKHKNSTENSRDIICFNQVNSTWKLYAIFLLLY